MVLFGQTTVLLPVSGFAFDREGEAKAPPRWTPSGRRPRYFKVPGFTISWQALRTEVSAEGDVGVTSGSYKTQYKDADGKVHTDTGKYLCTWKKVNGQWLANHDMWNSDSR